MGSPDLVVVEHLDTGLLTLHRRGCRHLSHAIITHEARPFWLDQIDKRCGHCQPPTDQGEETTQ